MQAELEALTDMFEKKMSEMVEENQRMINVMQSQIHETMLEETRKIRSMASTIQNDSAEQTEPPSTAWTKGPNGEELLVMNKPAADYMNRIFITLKEVLGELSKSVPGAAQKTT